MGEETNKWSREQGFFAANSGDILTLVIAALCGVIFILLVWTQWHMSDFVKSISDKQAASRAAASPQQPDFTTKPGETGVYLYPSKPAQSPKKQ